MNPIPEPAELHEAECNALGLYGLPAAALEHLAADRSGPAQSASADVDAQAAVQRRDPPHDDIDPPGP